MVMVRVMVKVRVKVKGMVMVRVEFLTTKDGKNEINLFRMV